jgi:hypothetical protein
MTHTDFDTCVESRINLCRKVLTSKGTEYADVDRLSNFKKAAGLRGGPPESALWGMAVKHIVSINDMINDLAYGIYYPTCVWDEKIGDALNYLFILRAQIEERKNK